MNYKFVVSTNNNTGGPCLMYFSPIIPSNNILLHYCKELLVKIMLIKGQHISWYYVFSRITVIEVTLSKDPL